MYIEGIVVAHLADKLIFDPCSNGGPRSEVIQLGNCTLRNFTFFCHLNPNPKLSNGCLMGVQFMLLLP